MRVVENHVSRYMILNKTISRRFRLRSLGRILYHLIFSLGRSRSLEREKQGYNMPSFEGTKIIVLQPSDSNVVYRFHFTVCSASTANDGAIPYGLTISQSSATCHREDGTNFSTQIISVTSLTSFATSALLSYSTAAGVGKYHLRFKNTLSDGSVKEFDFNRLVLKDL